MSKARLAVEPGGVSAHESEIFAPTLNLAEYLPWAFPAGTFIEFQDDRWPLSSCLDWPKAYSKHDLD